MVVTLGELSELVGGRLVGDGNLEITGAATIRDVRPGEITLADDAKLANQLAACDAAAVIVSDQFTPERLPHIVAPNVHAAFAKVVQHFHPPRPQVRVGVSPAAHVSPTAQLGQDVDVYPGAVIGDDVVVGDGCTIHAGACLMAGCRLGAGVTVFPGVVLYENTEVGDRVILHANAVVGAYGFGYEMVDGQHRLSAQLGNVVIEDDVEVGAGTTIDRGTYGPTVIGRGTKIDNLVMIAHNCRIGRCNILCSQVGIAGSTTTRRLRGDGRAGGRPRPRPHRRSRRAYRQGRRDERHCRRRNVCRHSRHAAARSEAEAGVAGPAAADAQDRAKARKGGRRARAARPPPRTTLLRPDNHLVPMLCVGTGARTLRVLAIIGQG